MLYIIIMAELLSLEEWELENEQYIFDELETELQGTGRSLNNTSPYDMKEYQDVVEYLYNDYLAGCEGVMVENMSYSRDELLDRWATIDKKLPNDPDDPNYYVDLNGKLYDTWIDKKGNFWVFNGIIKSYIKRESK